MASIEFRGSSYRIIFRYAGEKFSRSLKTDNRKSANASCARLEDNLRRLEQGLAVLPEGADVCQFLLSDGRATTRVAHKPDQIRTLGRLLDKFSDSIPSQRLEPTTEHCVKIHIRHLKRVLGTNRQLGTFGLPVLQEYVDNRALAKGLRDRTLSATTIKKEIATISMIWNWALNHGYVDSPLHKKGLRLPKTADKPPFQTIAEIERKIARGDLSEAEQADLWDAAFLTLPEIDSLLSVVKKQAIHPFIYPMFVFAAHTGARRSEILRSRIEDIDFEGRRVFLRERKKDRGRHTIRSVPMSPLLHEALKAWFKKHQGGPFTFRVADVIAKSSKDRSVAAPISGDEALHHFETVLLGTKWTKLRGWHIFRHSFCSNCAAKGIDQRMINAWVGHQTDEMVRRYRHLLPNQEYTAIASVFS
jgi:integrase